MKNNQNYHDAMVNKIEIDLKEHSLSMYITPYEKDLNYEGNSKILYFKGLEIVNISEGDASQLKYIYNISSQDKNGKKLYTISFSGPGVLEIMCNELIVE